MLVRFSDAEPFLHDVANADEQRHAEYVEYRLCDVLGLCHAVSIAVHVRMLLCYVDGLCHTVAHAVHHRLEHRVCVFLRVEDKFPLEFAVPDGESLDVWFDVAFHRRVQERVELALPLVYGVGDAVRVLHDVAHKHDFPDAHGHNHARRNLVWLLHVFALAIEFGVPHRHVLGVRLVDAQLVPEPESVHERVQLRHKLSFAVCDAVGNCLDRVELGDIICHVLGFVD